MSIRSELYHDTDRCPVCAARLDRSTDYRRVRVHDRVDLLVWCARCRAPSVIEWEAAA